MSAFNSILGAFKFGQHLSIYLIQYRGLKGERERMVKCAANGAFPGVTGGSQRYMKWRKWEHGDQGVGVGRKVTILRI